MEKNQENTGFTLEQIEHVMKLESIFMPRASRQRKEFYGSQQSKARFVHYTTAEAALNIINTKCMWLRNAKCMSDYSEVQHGLGYLQKYFNDEKTEKFKVALDKSAPDAATEAIKLFNNWLSTIQFNSYIASLSEHNDSEDLHGRLSMWRAFGDKSTRVAIVFNVPWFSGGAKALNVMFSPVAYLNEAEVFGTMDEVIQNIGDNDNQKLLKKIGKQEIIAYVFTMLRAGVTCLKHQGFHEEREWRAIFTPQFSENKLMEYSTEVIRGIPQKIYKVPLDESVSSELDGLELSKILDRIIIGPTQYPMAIAEALSDALVRAGIRVDETQRIFVSDIPIRD